MGNFKDLPADIALDIVTRLPAESILDCKLVCRKWRNLVSYHPSFSQLHLTHILNHSNESEGKLSFLVMDRIKKIHYFEYNEGSHDETPPTHSIREINLSTPFTSESVDYRVLGSFNGIVCLYGYQDYTACVFNLVTKEYVMLPSIKGNCDDDDLCILCSIGFGYLPSTNEYKVVGMYRLLTALEIVEVAVYTLGSGNGWRNVGRFDIEFAYDCEGGVGVFANGALHWRTERSKSILAFDLTEEKFREHISPPPPPENIWYDCSIGELDGVLYFRYTYSKISNIWLLKEKNDHRDMKEQVEHEPLGWSNEYSLPDSKKPSAFTKSGGVLYFNRCSLGIYDAIASTSKELGEFSGISQIFPHKNTLVSLKELGEKDIKVMDKLLQPVLVEIQETKSWELPIKSRSLGPGRTY